MFWRWWRLQDADRLSIWKRYGWFSALMFCGSCAGVLSYAAWSQWLVFYHDADYDAEGTQRGSAQFGDAVRSYATVSSGDTLHGALPRIPIAHKLRNACH